jgi:stringent starvation protein B
MISQKSYLIRAIYEWCVDNEFTPYLAANVDENTLVPRQYVQSGQIVLNISSNATKNILIDNDWITFKATFGGNIQDIAVPVNNVLAVFAKENGLGMQFNQETNETKKPAKSGGLKLVK